MQAHYPERFEREMGCTEREWLGWLPQAIGDHPWSVSPGHAQVTLAEGGLQLAWRVGEPRVIALMRMPRLHVQFAFSGVPDAPRHAFMKRFDLYMQRGGG